MQSAVVLFLWSMHACLLACVGQTSAFTLRAVELAAVNGLRLYIVNGATVDAQYVAR
jgi:hypothetical protein